MSADKRRQPGDEGARLRDEEVRESEERYRAIAESVFEGIILHADGKILDVNEATCTLFGYDRSEMIGMPVQQLAAPESRDLVLEKIRSGDTGPYEAVGLRKDGTRLVGELRATYAPYKGRRVHVAALRDMTDRRRAEDALRRSEAGYRDLVQHAVYGIYRSAPDGRLLMANPALVRLLGYENEEEVLQLSLGRDVYVDPEERRRVLARVEVERTSRVEVAWKRKDGRIITVRLSGRIVRGEEGRGEYYETIVEDVTEQRAVEEHLRQVQKLDSIGRLAGGIAHDLNNVLTAVLGYAGLLADGIRSGHPNMADIDEIVRAGERARDLTQHLLAFARKQVMVPRVVDPNTVVRDTERLLGPLLGEDIAIDLRLASEPGMGSTLKMYFPRATGPLTDAEHTVGAEARGGTERVLVVEDDPAVKDIAVRGLEAAGYQVRSASNGTEALAIAESLSEPIDLLLTDVVMPGMSGREVAEALRVRWPDLRVLYMSGYTENAMVHHGVLAPGVTLLPKPFSATALLEHVRNVLDAA